MPMPFPARPREGMKKKQGSAFSPFSLRPWPRRPGREKTGPVCAGSGPDFSGWQRSSWPPRLHQDETLPQMVVCLSPEPEKTVRWEGRGPAGGEEKEKGYSFRLTWHSRVLGRVEVAGVAREDEVELLVAVEKAQAEAKPEAWRALQELKSYLDDRGWKVKQVLFSKVAEGEEKAEPMPPRVDGWV